VSLPTRCALFPRSPRFPKAAARVLSEVNSLLLACAESTWARRQIGSLLLRSPMNPDESVFTKKNLDAMDAVMLPWAVESLEEQAALGMRMKVIFAKKGKTKQTKSHDTSSALPNAGEFRVWYDDSEGSNDDGDEMSFNVDDLSDASDTSESKVVNPSMKRILKAPKKRDARI
jgi:hypothetical protein